MPRSKTSGALVDIVTTKARFNLEEKDRGAKEKSRTTRRRRLNRTVFVSVRPATTGLIEVNWMEAGSMRLGELRFFRSARKKPGANYTGEHRRRNGPPPAESIVLAAHSDLQIP